MHETTRPYEYEKALGRLTQVPHRANFLKRLRLLEPAELAEVVSKALTDPTYKDEKLLAIVFAYAYGERLPVPAVHPITNKYALDAILQSRNEQLKVDIAKYRWTDLDTTQRELLVESGNAEARLEIATRHIADVTHVGFIKLLRDSDVDVADAAFTFGIDRQAQQVFIEGPFDETAPSTEKYAALARLEFDQLEAIRTKEPLILHSTDHVRTALAEFDEVRDHLDHTGRLKPIGVEGILFDLAQGHELMVAVRS